MSWRNTASRYGAVSAWLHWLMLLLFVAVYATIELRGIYPKGSEARDAIKNWHYMLGMLVFLLVWVRLAARFSGPTPVITPAPPAWQEMGAKLLHLALYALMIAMPLLGWAMLSADGKQIDFFGLHLPPLMGQDKTLGKTLKEIHETVGDAGYYLIGLHAAAALYHHWMVRDNTLRRMLPWGK